MQQQSSRMSSNRAAAATRNIHHISNKPAADFLVSVIENIGAISVALSADIVQYLHDSV